MDPIDTRDEETIALRREIESIVKQIDVDIHIHDFRIVKGDTHTNCIFDAVVPESFICDATVVKMISDAVKRRHPNHHCKIKIDRNYT